MPANSLLQLFSTTSLPSTFLLNPKEALQLTRHWTQLGRTIISSALSLYSSSVVGLTDSHPLCLLRWRKLHSYLFQTFLYFQAATPGGRNAISPADVNAHVMRTQFKAHFFFSTFRHHQFSLLTIWNINSLLFLCNRHTRLSTLLIFKTLLLVQPPFKF